MGHRPGYPLLAHSPLLLHCKRHLPYYQMLLYKSFPNCRIYTSEQHFCEIFEFLIFSYAFHVTSAHFIRKFYNTTESIRIHTLKRTEFNTKHLRICVRKQTESIFARCDMFVMFWGPQFFGLITVLTLLVHIKPVLLVVDFTTEE